MLSVDTPVRTDLPSLTDPELYRYGDQFAAWARLRREAPVAWHEHHVGGFWAVTSYAHGLEMLTDWSHFSSTEGIFLRPDPTEPYPGAGTMLALTDPPQHDILRKSIMGLFTTRAIKRLEDRARHVILTELDALVALGQADLVSDFAAKIPLQVSAELLGISSADVDMIARATTEAAKNSDEISGLENQQAHLELLMHYTRVIEERRREPQDDIVSALVAAQAQGAPITDDEIVLTCDNVIVAANETTQQTIASGILALLENPAQWNALQSGQVSPKVATEEFLRWASPVTHIMRTATQDCRLGDAQIHAGDYLVAWLPSMNRDEHVFEHADEFMVGRTPNRHIAFGGGVHFCIGANMARLVIRVFLEELIRLPVDITVTEPPRRIASYILSGLTTLPVRLTPR